MPTGTISFHAATLTTLLLALDPVFELRRIPWGAASVLVLALAVAVELSISTQLSETRQIISLFTAVLYGGVLSWIFTHQWPPEYTNTRKMASSARRLLTAGSQLVWVIIFPPVVRSASSFFTHSESPFIIFLTSLLVSVLVLDVRPPEETSGGQYAVILAIVSMGICDFTALLFADGQTVSLLEDVVYSVIGVLVGLLFAALSAFVVNKPITSV